LGHSVRRASIHDLRKLERPASLAGLIVTAPPDADDACLWNALQLVQFIGAAWRQNHGEGKPFFATISRLDGHFGLSSATSATGGGLAGLAKTVSQEWPQVRCKALDLAGDFSDVESAALTVVEELFLDGPQEVGIHERGRTCLQLEEAEIPGKPVSLPIA